jgi:HK97 gp10 family phage protein
MANEWVQFKVIGLDELQRKMEALPEKVARRGLRKALLVGGEVFKYAMHTGAPKDTGFLAEHFGVKVKIDHDQLSGTAYVGPQGKIDYPRFASGAYAIKRISGKVKKVGRIAVVTVARFLEFGTHKMAKKPFMTQAFETQKENALKVVANALGEVIEDAS